MQPDGLLHDNVQSIAVVDKQIFFGTVAGLAVYEIEEDRWEKHTPYHDAEILREDQIRWMELDGDYLWVLNWSASPNGAILKFDRRTDTWIEYTKDALPISSEVPFITSTRRLTVGEKDVWCATEDGGVLRYNKISDTWTHFTKSSGLPGHHATLVELDEPHGVWVAFLGGVAAHYDTRTEKWETVKVTEPGAPERPLRTLLVPKITSGSPQGVLGSKGTSERRKLGDHTQKRKVWLRAPVSGLLQTEKEYGRAAEGHYSWVRDRRAHGVSYYLPDDDTWTIYDRREGLRADETEVWTGQ